MKKIFGTVAVTTALLLIQNSAVAQTAAKDTGLSIILQIELIVFLILIGFIFGALMRNFPEQEIMESASNGQIALQIRTPVVRGFVSDSGLRKMLNAAVFASSALLIFYLVKIIMLLT